MISLAQHNPELLKEWDYQKNTIKPSEISYKSTIKVWWKCQLNHSYETRISIRTGKGKCGCPYCSSPARKVLPGFNDLETKYPDLAQEWHPTKNGKLTPNNVLCGTAKKVWWLGKCGHEYEQKIVSRVRGGNCPFCSHQKLLVGFNDFASLYPELLNEWDYNKNEVLPNQIMAGSHRKIWWKCPFGHSYLTFPYNRTGKMHVGCPICDKENHTSFPEQAIFYYLKKQFKDIENGNTSSIGMELDIYIPSIKTAIEYDGNNWHKNSIKLEQKKNKLCKDNNIRLIRIREVGLPILNDCLTITRMDRKSDKSLNDVIIELYSILNINDRNINVERDSSKIYSNYIKIRKENSILHKFSKLAEEWHPTKNGKLTPDMINYGSEKKVWWLGKCGHEWQMSVSDRTNQNCNCPICSGKRIVKGINDLKSVYPNLVDEWYYELNNVQNVFPENVAPHSDKKVWWKCKKCGHIWKTKIDTRTRNNCGCPLCGRKKADLGRSKSVKCIETNQIYDSLIDAEINTGINRICISNCCKGKQKTAGKKHWIYY